MGRGIEWEAIGGLNPPLRLFGLAMSPRSASNRPKHVLMAKEMSPYHWGDFQTHTFHVAPSMVSIISAMNLQGRQNSL